MGRSVRMFEIIQLLRNSDRPCTAQKIAEKLDVTKRTVYRDIASLYALRIPIEGEAGVGYIMRSGFDLPLIAFDIEEAEAVSSINGHLKSLQNGFFLGSTLASGDGFSNFVAPSISSYAAALSGGSNAFDVNPVDSKFRYNF